MALKRFRRFRKNRLAWYSSFLFLVFIFLSLTAEFWAGGTPHVLHYKDKTYYPLFFYYHPTEFGVQTGSVMDYRHLKLGPGDWEIWPLVQWDPLESNRSVETYPSPPTRQNLLGTDEVGRDVLARLLYGLRYTLLYSVVVWIFSYFLGTVLGALMGYAGGWMDIIGMRLIELMESIPVLLLLITVISIVEPSLGLLIVFSTLFGWTQIAVYMRGQFLALRHRDFVESARAIGASDSRIIFSHILPNSLTPIITFSPFTIASHVYSLSVLDYLGLGLRPPTPSWGELFGEAQKWFTTAEWLVWAPSVALLLTLTLLINIGQGVRDAFDSRA